VAWIVTQVAVPVPSPSLGARDFSLAALARMPPAARNALPDVSVFVTHQAYQEALTYGRPWGLPSEDERVEVPQYTVGDDGRMRRTLRTVKVFDQAWMQSVRAGAPPGSLEALLFAQGRPAAVSVPAAWRGMAAVLACVGAALCLLLAGTRASAASPDLIRSFGLRFNDGAKRNQAP